jgi:hypothetical protein
VAGEDEQSGLGAAPNSDPASETKDPTAVPKPPRAKSRAAKADPEQLAADIERTREELAETLDAIADKVSPKRVAKRTTKKVAAAVKETAHDAAASVKDTATTAREKVTGTSKNGTDWAPDPGPDAVTAPTVVSDLPPAAATEVPSTSYVAPAVTTPTTYESAGTGFKPEYVAAGAAVALLAWLLLRKRT